MYRLILFLTAVTTLSAASDAFGHVPLVFEPNQGQAGSAVSFVSRGAGYALALTPNEAVLALQPSGQIRMRWLGSRHTHAPSGENRLPGTSSYFVGSDARAWHSGIAQYGRVRYSDVYPGIDLIYYGKQHQLEYDWVVRPGGDASRIEMSFEGAQHLRVDDKGDLLLQTGGQTLIQKRPAIYQERDGSRVPVTGGYVLRAGKVTLALGPYDHSRALVIDPVVIFSTYLPLGLDPVSVTLDSARNVYVTGKTTALPFTTPNAYQSKASGGGDLFVAKLNSTATAILSLTYLGGSGVDSPARIHVASDGSILVGATVGTDFPFTVLPQPTSTTYTVLARISYDGTRLLYSIPLTSGLRNASTPAFKDFGVSSVGDSYALVSLGATGISVYRVSLAGSVLATMPIQTSQSFETELMSEVAIGPNDSVYVAGSEHAVHNYNHSFGPASPISNVIYQLNPTSLAIANSVAIGGNSEFTGFAVDVNGNVYLLGNTDDANFPFTGVIGNATLAGGSYNIQGYLMKIKADFSGYLYSELLDDNFVYYQIQHDVAVDRFGTACFAGSAAATASFPSKNSLANAPNLNSGVLHASVACVAPDGSLIFSSLFGGSAAPLGNDPPIAESFVNALAMDPDGNLVLTGQTRSLDFPLVRPAQTALTGTQQTTQDSTFTFDSFLIKMSSPAGQSTTIKLLLTPPPAAASLSFDFNSIDYYSLSVRGAPVQYTATVRNNGFVNPNPPANSVVPLATVDCNNGNAPGTVLGSTQVQAQNGAMLTDCRDPNGSPGLRSEDQLSCVYAMPALPPGCQQTGSGTIVLPLNANPGTQQQVCTTSFLSNGGQVSDCAQTTVTGTVTVGIQSLPAGLPLLLDGAPAPATAQLLSESIHNLTASDPNTIGGTKFGAPKWSTGATLYPQGIINAVIPAAPTTYTATYTAQAYLIAATAAGAGSISVVPTSPDGYYAIGTAVTITAQPSSGCSLTNFTGDTDGSTAPGANQITIMASKARSVTANFSCPGGVSNGSLRFVPIVPCRVADSRLATLPAPYGAPALAANETRTLPIPTAPNCAGIPANAAAFSVNVTVVPNGGPMTYLTLWPTGQSQPNASLLNNFGAEIKANGALVAAGTNGAISIFASNSTHIIVDLNGYFIP